MLGLIHGYLIFLPSSKEKEINLYDQTQDFKTKSSLISEHIDIEPNSPPLRFAIAVPTACEVVARDPTVAAAAVAEECDPDAPVWRLAAPPGGFVGIPHFRQRNEGDRLAEDEGCELREALEASEEERDKSFCKQRARRFPHRAALNKADIG